VNQPKYKKYLFRSKFIIDESFLKFIASGLIATFIRNFLLITLIDISNIALSTIISGIFATFISYNLNSKFVFKKRGYFIKFLILVLVNWIFEWLFLKLLIAEMNFDKIYAVFLVIPIFAFISFVIQKKFIFINRKL
tara:strand:- start:3055 stop:3465 length:411 start_codon:yes stop_codon:yes gene_type:complete